MISLMTGAAGSGAAKNTVRPPRQSRAFLLGVWSMVRGSWLLPEGAGRDGGRPYQHGLASTGQCYAQRRWFSINDGPLKKRTRRYALQQMPRRHLLKHSMRSSLREAVEVF